MDRLNALREAFQKDRYATESAMYIVSAAPGTACCAVDLDERHRNAAGGVMGGVYFTLADFAFAVATNQEAVLGEGDLTVSLDSDIRFLQPAEGAKMFAYAEPLRRSSRVCVYSIRILDEAERLLAQVTTTGYVRRREG